MTSTTDRAEHPDVAEISDLTEGLLAPDRTAAVRQHLDGCDLCAEVHASLEEIRGLLGAVPGPPRMPDDVARRIDAALAAEALLDAGVPDTRESEDAVDASASPSEGDRARVSRETSAPPPPDRPGGSARASTTGPGRKGRTRRGRRRVAVLGTVFTVAALGLGSVLLSSLDDTGRPEEERQVTAADTFTQGTLERQVTDLLGQEAPARGDGRTPNTFGLESEAAGASPRVLQQPTVPECVQEGIGSDDAALATETGVFQGRKALLVVLPDASDDRRVTAYIVEATCVDNPSAGPAEVLLKQSYSRP
ncbi:hypothetical protein G3I31_08395 [Streptomyces sp. SID9913]|uniref:Zf-HC2 domain-containing protein n=2 Tax=unclassified Streptomyces TaxID=2593676 RepID=A0A6G3QR87_9ACTN|nr:hypothetical protein [Streptomyces sp. S12]NEA85891.1 hypothetical protein [Streptomyces sp. SID14436]NEC80986.1 hypothetical protein [Streptomyces sp. SID7958]NED18156.1 hypothetical protein [Streptomyces sp. SID9913]